MQLRGLQYQTCVKAWFISIGVSGSRRGVDVCFVIDVIDASKGQRYAGLSLSNIDVSKATELYD
jgi:hypothetical protein